MLELTPQDIGEFKALFKKETGKDITDEQAREYALSLVNVVAFAVQPERPSFEL